ncbi:Vta1 like-domain-containing protein [Ochromonadaceae sp. CCMP2298]|nr:Vta1 like-domain-containing protein [Ochromonadaceae sp. CCMP2298]
MAAQIPPSLKLITSACRRSEELEKDPNHESQVVAYYCRLFVVVKASTLCSTPPTGPENAFLNGEIEKLEKVKPILGLNQAQGATVCRSYANSVFEKADDEDRQGVADKATAKIFYASGTFFDILEQFGEIDNEISEKRKYAKWKTTEILNSIKAGLKPTPGGFSEGLVDLHISDPTTDIPAAPTAPPCATAAMMGSVPKAPFAVTPPPAGVGVPPPPFQAYAPAPILAPAPSSVSANLMQYYTQVPPPVLQGVPYNPKDARVQDAVELVHFAVLAMNVRALCVGLFPFSPLTFLFSLFSFLFSLFSFLLSLQSALCSLISDM